MRCVKPMILVAAALFLAAAPLRVDGFGLWVPEAVAKGGENGKGNNQRRLPVADRHRPFFADVA